MDIAHSIAIVTGGASGLGKATAAALTAHGARVVLLDLPNSDGDAAARSIADATVFIPSDITSAGEVEAAMNQAAALGSIRVAVNCAGVATPGKVIGRSGPMPLDDFEKVVRVNLFGTFNVLRLGAHNMLDADLVGEERGVSVDTASVAAFDGQIGQAAYAA